VVTAREHDQVAAAPQHLLGRFVARLDGTGTAHVLAHTGEVDEEGVKESVDRVVDPPLPPPAGEQDGQVGGRRRAGVVADEQHRPLGRQVVEAPHLRCEVRRVRLEHRLRSLDEFRISLG
jgi:hypothetical protein